MTALRGLSNEQRTSITSLNDQMEDLRARLDESTEALEESLKRIQKMNAQFASYVVDKPPHLCSETNASLSCSDMMDKDREMANKVDEMRFSVSAMWEERLL